MSESNISGSVLRESIEKAFLRRGVQAFPYSENQGNGDLLAPRIVLKRVPFVSFFGKRTAQDDLVFRRGHEANDIRIICNHQTGSGSAEQKLMHVLANINVMHENEVWLVIDGGGHTPELVEYIKHKARKIANRLVLVLTEKEAHQRIKQLLQPVRDAAE